MAGLAERSLVVQSVVDAKPKFSVGGVGDHPASFNRRKIIHGGEPINSGYEFHDLATGAFQRWGDALGTRGRVSVLALTTEEAKNEILAREQFGLETAFPVQTAGGELWVLGAAQNGPDRTGVNTVDDVSNRIHSLKREPRAAGDYADALHANYTLVQTIPDGMVDSLHQLWGQPFGWTAEELVDLQQEINGQSGGSVRPEDRTVFFAGVEKDGEFASAAMAEGLVLQGIAGEPVVLVESTEWAARPAARRTGAIRAAVSTSLAEVVGAYEGHRAYTIFAETNGVNTSAPSVGLDIGMQAPDVRYDTNDRVPGVRMRNVGIGDGLPAEGLVMDGVPVRDFGVLQLQPESISTRFSPSERARVGKRLQLV